MNHVKSTPGNEICQKSRLKKFFFENFENKNFSIFSWEKKQIFFLFIISENKIQSL